MTRQLTRSHEHFRRALTRLPLGVASNFRYWGDDRTIYVKSGRGARIVDLDDNVYVDYRMGYGPAILGYADERVDAAARAGMEVGGVFALSTERELSVAERIARMVPAAELVRFLELRHRSGHGGAAPGARLHRQGRLRHSRRQLPRPVRCGDVVHADGQVVAGRRSAGRPYSEGIPLSTRSFAHFVQANDANQLEDVFKRHAGRIACLLIEPIMGNCLGIAAEPEYVRAARALCDQYGVVLIIDEVKTGFRVARGGVQELYGVKADLCTFAKAVANGYPISVLAGREEIMRKIGKGVAHGGTYTAHSVSLAAAEKTLEILEETDALERDRAVRHAAAAGHARHPERARHSAQLRRPSVDERPVLCARSAAHLPRLEGQRLRVLRRDRARAARPGRAVRAGFARALVRQRGARRFVPQGYARRLRGGDRRHAANPEVHARAGIARPRPASRKLPA